MGENATGAAVGAAHAETGGAVGIAPANQSGSQTNSGSNPNGTGNGEPGAKHTDNSNLERLIQAAVDRATNKLGNENKELKNQIQQLQTLNMTDAEKHEHEISEREKALRAGEAALKAEDPNGTVVIHGFINTSKLPAKPTEDTTSGGTTTAGAKTALKSAEPQAKKPAKKPED